MQDTVGHYRVLDRIGAGGIGEVYRARDTKQGRTVVVKAVAADIAADPGRREALLADARAAARLTHPNLATLYEIVEEDDRLFLVFDFAAGESLRTVVGGRPLNPRRAIDLAVQIADALADAHAEGIAHGDLKPDNVIVTPRGNAKILDFGLSRWTGGGAARAAAARLSAPASPAVVLGTIAYLSPEQVVGEPSDAPTDIFSLGVILFEMLTGRLPFAGTSLETMALHIAQVQPPAVTSVNPALPHEIDPIVARALSKSVAGRYESAAALAAELRSVAAILDVRATVAAEHAGPVTGASAPRRGMAWLIGIVLALAAAAAAWWWIRG